ncbi:MAG: hypothetical protein ACP6IS_02635 [Candidatus Asgardarchaeia archaeon]
MAESDKPININAKVILVGSFLIGLLGILALSNIFFNNIVTQSAYTFFILIKIYVDRIIALPLFIIFLLSILLLFVGYEAKIILEKYKTEKPGNVVVEFLLNLLGPIFKEEHPDKSRSLQVSNRNLVIGIALVMLIHILIVVQRYQENVGILGFDSPYYIYNAELVHHFGLITFLRISRPIPTAIAYLFYLLFGDNFDLIGVAMPITLALLYAFLILFAIFFKTKDYRFSIYVGLAAPLNYIFTRASYDLYGQLLANAFLIVFLIVMASILETEKLSSKGLLKLIFSLSFILGLLYFTHFWTTLVTMLFAYVAVIIAAINEYIKTKQLTSKLKNIFSILFLLIIFGVVGTIVKFNLVEWFLGLIGKDIFPFTIPSGWVWYPSVEIPIIWVISIIGCVTLFKKSESLGFVTLLWTIYVTSLVFILGYVQTYRIFLLYPLPIFVGAGLDALHDNLLKAKHIRFYKRIIKLPNNKRLFTIIFMFMVLSLLIGETTVRAYFPEYNFRPSNEAIDQLTKIRDRFGFQNESILVIISTKKLKASYYWAVMLVGSNIYIGSLLDLVEGRPDFLGKVYPDWQLKDIIIPEAAYPLNPIEKAMTREIDNGIYKVANKTLLVDALTGVYELYSSLKVLIRNSSKFMQDAPIALEVTTDNSIKVQYGFSYTEILIQSTVPNKIAQAEFLLPKPDTFTNFIIGYRAKLNNSIVRVDLISSDETVVTSIYLKSVEHRNLIDYTSFTMANITRIRFVIFTPYPTSINPDFAIIDFIALS